MNNEPVFFHTTCCAMGILSANNATPFKDLKDDLENLISYSAKPKLKNKN